MILNNAILYIYTTTNRYRYSNVQKQILNNIQFYFAYHTKNLNKNNFSSPTLFFNDDEKYENIPLKTFNCLSHFLTTNKKFFIKINDDCLLDIKKLEEKFSSFLSYDVIGNFIKNDYANFSDKDMFKAKHIHYYKMKDTPHIKPKQVINVDYPEGSFYILSRNAVEMVLSKYVKQDFIQHLDNYIGEDMTMGLFLSSFKTLKYLDIKQFTEFNMDITKDFLSIHPVNHIFLEKLLKIPDSDKLKFISSIQFCNEYVLKDKFLNELYEKYSSNSASF